MLAEDVCARLRVGGVDARYYRSTGSTQDEAFGLAADPGVQPIVVVAGSQSSGRGRLGRTWLSPEGGLYASILFRTGSVPPSAMTVRAGAAVVAAVRANGIPEALLKWPNDCLVHGRKLCGILAESFPRQGVLIVGIGVNVRPDPVLATVRGLPGGVEAACVQDLCDTDPVDLCTAVILAVTGAFRSARQGVQLDVARIGAMLWTHGHVSSGDGSGVVEGVDSAGRLMLRGPDGVIRPVSVGEVRDACCD